MGTRKPVYRLKPSSNNVSAIAAEMQNATWKAFLVDEATLMIIVAIVIRAIILVGLSKRKEILDILRDQLKSLGYGEIYIFWIMLFAGKFIDVLEFWALDKLNQLRSSPPVGTAEFTLSN